MSGDSDRTGAQAGASPAATADAARQKAAEVQEAAGQRVAAAQADAQDAFLERPEIFVGGAFAAGFLLAKVLRRVADG
jgi:hypothetical protein